MKLNEALAAMSYGDKFIYIDNIYMLIDFNLSDCFLSKPFQELVMALDMTTFKVVCFDKNWEVEVM